VLAFGLTLWFALNNKWHFGIFMAFCPLANCPDTGLSTSKQNAMFSRCVNVNLLQRRLNYELRTKLARILNLWSK